MSSISGIDTVSETELFESLNLSDKVECSFSDCTLEAVSMLKCPEDESCETMCNPHTQITLNIQHLAPDELIVFDGTCGHQVRYGDCTVVPLGK